MRRRSLPARAVDGRTARAERRRLRAERRQKRRSSCATILAVAARTDSLVRAVVATACPVPADPAVAGRALAAERRVARAELGAARTDRGLVREVLDLHL